MDREIHILRIATGAASSALTAAQLERGSGFSVRTATTASEARRIASTTPVDCVVCDAELESTTGLDLLAALREDDPSLPFFLVLSGDGQTTVDEALAAGVTDIVEPETDPLLVAARVRNAVAGTSAIFGTERRDHAPNEADYRSLIEDVLDVSYVGTFVLDADFRVVWINDSIETYFGLDSGIIGADKRELIDGEIKGIFQDPALFAERVCATYDDNSYTEQFECHVLPGEGREDRWLEHRSYPITHGPYAGGRIEHYVDITARKKREQELESERKLLTKLFETSPVGIVLLDSAGQISRANNHGELVLGLSQSAIADRRYDDPNWEIHDENGEAIPSEELPFARVRQTGRPVFDYEHGITLSDGTKRWLSVNASPLLARDGTVERVICAIVDITAIRESERELARHNERLAEFAGIVSHDLRNPLNVLGGSLELADETDDPDHFERCYRAISRMEQLIDDLLSLARSGAEIDHTEPVDVGRLAVDCWQNLSVAEATLQIETEQQIVADKSRLTQLLENLFRNSVEHGGSTVMITVGALADGFFVADDGPGISPSDRELIFERGYSSTRGGTGLGLAIVEQIAEAHGWEIELADAETGGLRIELTGVELVDTETDSGTEQTDQSYPSGK
jgi:PAS domain S-box-containing protein